MDGGKKIQRHANQIVSDECFTKNLNVSIGNAVFPEEQIYRGWCLYTLVALLRPVHLFFTVKSVHSRQA